MFTQEELDLKSEIIDYPILKKFEEVSRIEIDWNKFHNRREFRAYTKSLLNMENQEIAMHKHLIFFAELPNL